MNDASLAAVDPRILSFIQEFIKVNKGNKIDDIFAYSPVSATGKKYISQLRKMRASNVTGRLALEQMNSFSIMQAIYKIMEMHKKLHTKVNSKPTGGFGMSWVEDIMNNPSKYASSQAIISAKKLEPYNNITVQEILNIAVKVDNFYISEKSDALSSTEESADGETSSEITRDGKEFNDFINNKIKDFNGKVSSSLTNNMRYIIGDIKKIRTDEAKELIEALENFVGYVREGEPTDWLQKATNALNRTAQAANALKLGT
jgi:hypothetical protein